MRIVFLHANPFPAFPGGIENWLYNVIRELHENYSVQILVICPESNEPPFHDVSTFHNLSFIPTRPIPGYIIAYRKVKQVSRLLSTLLAMVNYLWWILTSSYALRHTKEDDRIIAIQAIPGMLPVVLLRIFGLRRRVICSMRGRVGLDLSQQGNMHLSRFYKIMERFVLRYAAAIHSNGADTASYVKDELGYESVIIPNGVDFCRFSNPSLNSKHSSALSELKDLREEGTKVIMTVATLRDVKGIRYLIQAAQHLVHQGRADFRMVFVGKGDQSVYQEYAKTLGVDRFLVFTGEQKDVSSFLHQSDIAVAISGGGGVSNAAVEMMATGKPVIAWNNDTYCQLIQDGISGHLVTERDTAALAEGIDTLLDNPEYARELGKNAQAVVQKYDWQSITSQLLGLIKAL